VGTYIRKAFSLGPFRLNLSRSGLGASFGVKGARIGAGPRGMYVHAGRGGLYYRQYLNPATRRSGIIEPPVPESPSPQTLLRPIESADVTQLSDSSSAELLEELNRVRTRIQLAPAAVFLFALTFAGLGAVNLQPWAYAAAALALLLALLFLRHIDVTHGTAILRYDLDPEAEAAFSSLRTGFDQLRSSSAIWHIQASGETDDWKRNAGASRLIDRQSIYPLFAVPPRVHCNLEVPMLPAGRQKLYFFPDRLLIYDRAGVGAVQYSELSAESAQTRFIEEGPVPTDSQVVDRTWKYVNKSGGADRRFSNNRELPIVSYGVLHLASATGLNEMFNCSSPENAAAFAASISRLNVRTK
jgi:Protein of unknown function (DUF4236)